MLGEAAGMLGFLFTDDDELAYEDDALATLKDDAAATLQASYSALEGLDDFTTADIEAALREALIEGLGLKPRLAFGPLRVRAAARQVLTEAEFAAELRNPRVWKYVAFDPDGQLAGLTTLTDDVSTMPWISPEYFAHHYPEQWGRGAVFYVGVTLVRPEMRHDQVFAMMAKHVALRVSAARGVLGYDICGYNDQTRALARVTERILNRVADFDVRKADVQTYYVAQATGRD